MTKPLITHEVGLASKLIMKTMNKMNNVSVFLMTLSFALIVAGMLQPFYKSRDGTAYSIIGSDNVNGPIGCLGSCSVTNKNCVGDDATVECQVVQAFFILAAVFAGLSVFSWLTDISLFSGNMFGKFPFLGTIESNLRTYAVKVSGGFGGAFASLLCLFIGFMVAMFATNGLSMNNSMNLSEKEVNKAVVYDDGFKLTMGALFALMFACLVGSKSVSDYKIIQMGLGR